MAGSHARCLWRCSLGHEWRAVVHSRTRGNGCPYCGNQRVLVGFNDLATTNPGLAAVALFDPTTVIGGTNKRLRWRCSEGHEWTVTGNSRANDGTGCPTCAKYGFRPENPGYTYLLSHPDMGAQQIGITNNPKDRVAKHQSRGWVALDVRGPMDGYLARNWETDILVWLRNRGIPQAPGTFDGYTKSWSDRDYQATSLAEIMYMIRDADSAEPQ
ncbi:MAG: hypothetical protein KGP01_06090 [Actinomycetales bacterium]|nr:hypothetical protein [Actinomycetales bacterium]